MNFTLKSLSVSYSCAVTKFHDLPYCNIAEAEVGFPQTREGAEAGHRARDGALFLLCSTPLGALMLFSQDLRTGTGANGENLVSLSNGHTFQKTKYCPTL